MRVGAGYPYGFNGKERDDEAFGSGNSYDFGARIYDSRLGRWMSLDPLQAKYPQWSPYTGMGDNPVFYIDVDGKYFTGNTQNVKDLYAIVSRLVEQGTGGEKLKQFKTQLELMDESDIEFNVVISQKMNSEGGKGGETSFDIEGNSVTLEIDQIYRDEGAGSNLGRVAHELKHGAQFMEGELDFYDYNGDGEATGAHPKEGGAYDVNDEYDAVDVQSIIDQDQKPIINPIEREKKVKNQKDEYSNSNRYPNKTNVTTDDAKRYNKKYMSKDKYTPNAKQKNEKKTILK